VSYYGLEKLVLEARERRINQRSISLESPLIRLKTLNEQPELTELPAEQQRLMGRLQSGQIWLTATNAKLETEDAIDTPLNEKMAEAFDLFGKLEGTLRAKYQYTGCIHGPGRQCPDDAVALCEACSRG
jgi:hypothetical protein